MQWRPLIPLLCQVADTLVSDDMAMGDKAGHAYGCYYYGFAMACTCSVSSTRRAQRFFQLTHVAAMSHKYDMCHI